MGLAHLLVGIVVALATRVYLLRQFVPQGVRLRRHQIAGVMAVAALMGVLIVTEQAAPLVVLLVGNAAVLAFMRYRPRRPSA